MLTVLWPTTASPILYLRKDPSHEGLRGRAPSTRALRSYAVTNIDPFPKIPLYRAEADPVHLVRRVVALEKLDGTNTRIGLSRADLANGSAEPVVGGRVLMETEAGYSQSFLGPLIRSHRVLCERLASLVALHNADIVLYGETCGGRIQRSGFIYGPQPHFVLFAATIAGRWMSWSRPVAEDHRAPALTIRQLAERLQVPTPPILYEGEADRARFSELIDQPSPYSIAVGFDRRDVDRSQEGIVIWADPLLLDPHQRPIVAKLKHPRRREVVDVNRASGLDDFAERVMPPERLRHAIEHLQAAGKWPSDPSQQIERAVRRAIQDVAKEVDAYQLRLAEHGKKATRSALERAGRRSALAILRPD